MLEIQPVTAASALVMVGAAPVEARKMRARVGRSEAYGAARTRMRTTMPSTTTAEIDTGAGAGSFHRNGAAEPPLALEGSGRPGALTEGPADAGTAKTWSAEPAGAGSVLLMFFQTLIYE
ncbi:hypothetical protein GCM10010496_33430 [Streptomyces asoensis]|nr:hypothetical protein GCM10010496_33430 [Streptomyces asoensis]